MNARQIAGLWRSNIHIRRALLNAGMLNDWPLMTDDEQCKTIEWLIAEGRLLVSDAGELSTPAPVPIER